MSGGSEILRQHVVSHECEKMQIDEVQPVDFKVYLNWLHDGVLRTRSADDERDIEYSWFTDGYFLGAKLKDREYCNAMISAFFDKAHEVWTDGSSFLPGSYVIASIYEEDRDCYRVSEAAVVLKKVLVEFYAREANAAQLTKALRNEDMPPAFIDDLVRRLVQDRQRLIDLNICEFHQHVGDHDCNNQEPARKRRRVK